MSWTARRLSGRRPDDRLPRVSRYNHDPLVSRQCRLPPLPRVSCYNTAPASDALCPHSPRRRYRRRVSVTSLHSIRQPQDLQITLSTVEWKDGPSLNIGYSRVATYTFFTNLARWKFPYENRLVEISREYRIRAMPYMNDTYF